MTQTKLDLHPSEDEEAQQIMAARMDPQAFGPLYDRYAPPIYRYLLSRLGNVDEARDITSQTFLTAFEAFPHYRHQGYFSAWLFSIARSKYIDFVRKSGHRSEGLNEKIQMTLEDPLGQVIETERVGELKTCIQALLKNEQELLRLRYVAGLSFAEMASFLKRNEDAVKKSIYRLLIRLQNQLEV